MVKRNMLLVSPSADCRRFRSMTSPFRVTGHFESSAPNELKSDLGHNKVQHGQFYVLLVSPSLKHQSISLYD